VGQIWWTMVLLCRQFERSSSCSYPLHIEHFVSAVWERGFCYRRLVTWWFAGRQNKTKKRSVSIIRGVSSKVIGNEVRFWYGRHCFQEVVCKLQYYPTENACICYSGCTREEGTAPLLIHGPWIPAGSWNTLWLLNSADPRFRYCSYGMDIV
jgi:hypothetical protein